jgi:hypothetical protein
MKTSLLLTAAIVPLALCACTTPAVFRDAKTGQVEQCTSSTPGVFPINAQHEIDTGSDAYVRMGWVKQ